MKNAVLALLLISAIVMVNSFCNRYSFAEKVSLVAECDGESTYDKKNQRYELDKNVKLAYGEIELQCGWALVILDPESKQPTSFTAKGFHKNATDEEKAKARLKLVWKGYKLSCSSIKASFKRDESFPETISAEGDVWMLINDGEYTVHSARVTFKSIRGVDEAEIEFFGDTTLPKTHVIGKEFVAIEEYGKLEINPKSRRHSGTGIEIVFNVENATTVLPAQLEKLKAKRLAVMADRFAFTEAGSYTFTENCKVDFGELSIRSEMISIINPITEDKPVQIEVSSEKKKAEISFRGMFMKASKFNGQLDKDGKVKHFEALGGIEARVIDSKDREITASCEKAEFSANVVTLSPKESEKVQFACKAENWKGTATWIKFTRAEKRWNVSTFEQKIEYGVGD